MVRPRVLAPLAALLLVLIAALPVAAETAVEVRPATPQPDPESLQRGLAVEYYYDVFNDTQELEAYVREGPGEQGPPLPNLDYKTGVGRVLTSNQADFVGARITGYIELPEPGTYRFVVTSNDGVRLSIGGAELFEDPKPHPDADSPPLAVEAPTAGFYPIEVLYYEKKRTSTLKLRWQPPGSAGLDIVPPSALKH